MWSSQKFGIRVSLQIQDQCNKPGLGLFLVCASQNIQPSCQCLAQKAAQELFLAGKAHSLGCSSGSSLEKRLWGAWRNGKERWKNSRCSARNLLLKALTSPISKDNLLFICNPAVAWELQIVTHWCFNCNVLKVPVILVPVSSFLNFY